MSLLEKRNNYEASCQSKSVGEASVRNANAKPAKAKSSAVAERMRAKYGVRDRSSPDSHNDMLPKRKLENTKEQTVLKAGLRRLHKEMVTEKGVNILELPKNPDGSSKVMRSSFFEKLLSDRIEIKGSLESDVAAAQLDIRHLSVEQLLTLRIGTMDFLTESSKFNAHNNFLNTLDQHMFEKITVRCCEYCDEHVPIGVKPQALFSIGFRIALTLGAADVFAADEGINGGQAVEQHDGVTPLPSRWIISLEDASWQDARFAIFNIVDLSFKVVHGGDFSVPPEETIAVVRDRSTGSGQARMMFWEVSCIDPREVGEDIVSYVEIRTRTASNAQSRKLNHDLEEALQKARCRNPNSPSISEVPLDSSRNLAPPSVDIASVPLAGNRRDERVDVPRVSDQESDLTAEVADESCEVADESEEGVALLAHQRAVVLNGNTTEGRSVKTVDLGEVESQQMLVKPREPTGCFASCCFVFVKRPAK